MFIYVTIQVALAQLSSLSLRHRQHVTELKRHYISLNRPSLKIFINCAKLRHSAHAPKYISTQSLKCDDIETL